MKRLIFIPLLFISILAWSQAQFIIQNNTKTEVYNTLSAAVTNAVAGDTIYLPGGGYELSPTTISKQLHWVGHGHYPAATGATYQSRITSNLIFDGDCDGSSFEGIFFHGALTFGSSDNEAINIRMKRCRVGGVMNLRKTTSDSPLLNFVISECIIDSHIDARNGQGCSIDRSILCRNIANFKQSQFINIIHAPAETGYYDAESIEWCTSCTFKNSIFTGYSGTESSSSNTFINNVCTRSTLSGDFEHPGTGNTFIGNTYSVAQSNIFTSITGNIWTFSYDNDYSLVSGSPAIDHGDDGNDAGIYGTVVPYKTNAVPYYPHINSANIASKAVDGQLSVTISVQAQNK